VSPATDHGGINLRYVDENQLVTHNLMLALPNGEKARERAGRRREAGFVLAGSGKSTLLRALA
jgi:putative ATP-binding cassette transporter